MVPGAKRSPKAPRQGGQPSIDLGRWRHGGGHKRLDRFGQAIDIIGPEQRDRLLQKAQDRGPPVGRTRRHGRTVPRHLRRQAIATIGSDRRSVGALLCEQFARLWQRRRR